MGIVKKQPISRGDKVNIFIRNEICIVTFWNNYFIQLSPHITFYKQTRKRMTSYFLLQTNKEKNDIIFPFHLIKNYFPFYCVIFFIYLSRISF